MCLNDWRLGLLTRSVLHPLSGGPGVLLSLPKNQQRVGITFFLQQMSDGTNSGVIWCEGSALVFPDNVGFPVHITLATHGDLPTRNFEVIGVDAEFACMVVEYFMPANYLAAGLQEFQRQVPQVR